MDRFSRNLADSINTKQELKRNGVDVVSVTEYFDNSPQGIYQEQCVDAQCEMYSKNLGMEIRKGFIERAHNGLHTGGIPPLAYDVDVTTKKLVINEREAQAVRKIYDMFISHYSMAEICRELNHLGYLTKKGGEFKKNSLHDILRNKKYCGYYVYNRRAEIGENGGNTHKEKNKEDIVEVKGAVPAIISEKTYNQAIRLLDKRKKVSGTYSAKNIYMLSGKVKCAHCGCNMSGRSSTNGKHITTLTYNCEQRRKTKNGCPNMNIRKDKLDELVAEKLKEYIFTAENVPKLYEKLLELNNSRNGENQCTIKRIQKRIKSNERDKGNIIRAIKQGLNAEDFKDELDRLREEKKTLEDTLEELKSKNMDDITEDTIWALRDKFTDYLTNNRNAEISCLIDTFVDSVTEDNNKVIIKLNI